MSPVVLLHLEPIVVAETSRGNPPVGGWQVFAEHSVPQWRLEFLNPLDTDAILAEFALSEGVWARDHQVGSDLGQGLMFSPYRLTRAQRHRNEQWWERWSAAPQAPARLPSPELDRDTVPRLPR